MNKLGALYLFTSQGIVFMHQGQEWARSKVIANTDAPDEFEGQIDHNSYEKDNETNWLNWNEKGLNSDLVDYYKGLIQLRKKYPSLRKSNPEDFKFFDFGKQIAVGYIVKEKMAIIMNGSKTDSVSTTLPIGNWRMIVDGDSVQLDSHKIMSEEINIAPISGMVLVRN
jgi:pullulanase/glycogen debranching enzyme